MGNDSIAFIGKHFYTERKLSWLMHSLDFQQVCQLFCRNCPFLTAGASASLQSTQHAHTRSIASVQSEGGNVRKSSGALTGRGSKEELSEHIVVQQSTRRWQPWIILNRVCFVCFLFCFFFSQLYGRLHYFCQSTNHVLPRKKMPPYFCHAAPFAVLALWMLQGDVLTVTHIPIMPSCNPRQPWALIDQCHSSNDN